ncbi:MAG: hypothetical protein JEZ08_20085 [Clostridiales bacterium]|nr:hypothetical protein [Clostridiales bacterium]
MAEITRLQIKILEDLYKRDVESDVNIKIQTSLYDLDEKDEIMKIRELVYNIDKLIALYFIDVDQNYYIESDFVSFEYMNSAVEIIENRVKISSLGIDYIEARGKTGFKKIYNYLKLWFNRQFVDRPYKLALTHLISFLLGALVMWGVAKLL